MLTFEELIETTNRAGNEWKYHLPQPDGQRLSVWLPGSQTRLKVVVKAKLAGELVSLG